MGLEPTQDYDKNGNKSNSGTRETATWALANDKGLTAEQRKHYENQSQCARGDEFHKLQNANRMKGG